MIRTRPRLDHLDGRAEPMKVHDHFFGEKPPEARKGRKWVRGLLGDVPSTKRPVAEKKKVVIGSQQVKVGSTKVKKVVLKTRVVPPGTVVDRSGGFVTESFTESRIVPSIPPTRLVKGWKDDVTSRQTTGHALQAVSHPQLASSSLEAYRRKDVKVKRIVMELSGTQSRTPKQDLTSWDSLREQRLKGPLPDLKRGAGMKEKYTSIWIPKVSDREGSLDASGDEWEEYEAVEWVEEPVFEERPVYADGPDMTVWELVDDPRIPPDVKRPRRQKVVRRTGDVRGDHNTTIYVTDDSEDDGEDDEETADVWRHNTGENEEGFSGGLMALKYGRCMAGEGSEDPIANTVWRPLRVGETHGSEAMAFDEWWTDVERAQARRGGVTGANNARKAGEFEVDGGFDCFGGPFPVSFFTFYVSPLIFC